MPPGRSATRRSLRLISCLAEIAAEQWDALFDPAYPFTRHSWLHALEVHGCVGRSTGWEPCHLVLEEADGKLAGAAPLYMKHHSYGEFVFDFAWAQASHQLRQPYYPKLLCAIPFVPSAGPRLAAVDAQALEMLSQGLWDLAEREKLSSAHLLFPDQLSADALQSMGWLERRDLQFQWFNRGDADFAAFTARLTSEKRKKLLRERRRVAEAGIRFEARPGHQLDEREWHAVYALYANTYEERGQSPYLTPDFLLDLGRRCDTPLQVILGYQGARLVATALTLIGGDTLYGRHWGTAEHFHSLHFECCYHQGIELCLKQGLLRYDAGTQGEHKLARGFEPVITRSFHRLRSARLSHAVENFLTHERRLVAARHAELMQHTPYRQEPAR